MNHLPLQQLLINHRFTKAQHKHTFPALSVPRDSLPTLSLPNKGYLSSNSRGRGIPSALPEDPGVCGSGLNFSSGFVWFLMIPLTVQSRAPWLDDLGLHSGIPSAVIPKRNAAWGLNQEEIKLCVPHPCFTSM